MSRSCYVVLVHYPITNRNAELVTTAVTNLDLHDISRSVRTFGLKKFYILTPLEPQHDMVGRILAHWRTDQSLKYHPKRFEALSLVELVKDFDEVKKKINELEGQDPEVILTDARVIDGRDPLSYRDFRRELEAGVSNKPVLIVFGTGWGIHPSFYPEVHRTLAPVYGPKENGGYNHLSVRAAVAIILDRLFGL